MNLRDDISQIKTDPASLLSFARIVGGIFLVIGILIFFKNKNTLNVFAIAGIALLALSVTKPHWLKPIYIVWMTLGLLMVVIVSPILFSLLYFVAITPIALLMRLSGKKFLEVQIDPAVSSYWIPGKTSESIQNDAENQF